MKTEQIDFQSIMNALMTFSKISTFEEQIQFLEQHPEILDEKTDILINFMINQTSSQGEENTVQLLHTLQECVHSLRSIIQKGLFEKTNNFSVFMLSVEQASLATKRYFQESEHSLDKAVEAWENLLKHPDFENSTLELQVGILYDIAIAYNNRYNDQGNFEDLECVIAYCNRGINIAPSDFPLLPNLLNNLGVGLRERYKHTNNFDDLLKSFFLYLQAYKKAQSLKANTKYQFSVKSVESELYLDNLCDLLFSQYPANGNFNELKKAVGLYEMFVKLFIKNKAPHVFRNLGNGFYRLYEYSNSQEYLQKAIDNWEKSLEKIPKNSPEQPKYINNLALGLSVRYTHIGTKEDLKQAIEYYKKSCEISLGSELVIQDGLQTARNWLNWAFNRQSWNEVQQAYDYTYQASTRLVQIQLTRQHQELWLKETQGLATQAAYALAKENKLTEAAVTLERGLAQLLSEALARDRADLEQLKALGHNDLHDRYQQAVNDWHLAQTARPEEVRTLLQTARQALNE